MYCVLSGPDLCEAKRLFRHMNLKFVDMWKMSSKIIGHNLIFAICMHPFLEFLFLPMFSWWLFNDELSLYLYFCIQSTFGNYPISGFKPRAIKPTNLNYNKMKNYDASSKVAKILSCIVHRGLTRVQVRS